MIFQSRVWEYFLCGLCTKNTRSLKANLAMESKYISKKLIKSGYRIKACKVSPDTKSILIILHTYDKVYVENSGDFGVNGPNKDKIEAILCHESVLKKAGERCLVLIKKAFEHLVSAIIGGIVGNRADSILSSLF